MASKSSFFSKILSFFLVLIIIGGVGFLGYKLIANKNMSMSMNMGSQSDQSSSSQDQMNMGSDSSSQDKMNMSGSDTNEKAIPQYVTNQVNVILQDKEQLDKNIKILNDTLEIMTLDPYSVDTKVQTTTNNTNTNNTTSGQANNNNNTNNSTDKSVTNTQGNTVQGNTTTYDPNKMEQLNNGIYKVSLGMQLLNQLKDNIELQMEQASINYQNAPQYYQNQYYMTVQNKSKLMEALTYVNEASTLLNTNPYVSKDGTVVYDKERMTQIHKSVYKFAEAVGGFNKLNDDFTKQTVSLGSLAQSSQNSQSSMNMPQMNQSSNSIFGNINIATVANILLITFIFIFIISIFGFIARLLKPKEAK